MTFLLGALLWVAGVGIPLDAVAQSASGEPAYPTKPIRLLVPFASGGSPDIQGRMLAAKLAQRLGQQVVVDNRAGANGIIAMEIVARALPDGYTIIIGTVGTWAVHPNLYKLPYDVARDFAPIIHVATTPAVLVVHPSVPVKSVAELIALAQRKPGEITYASSGIGGFGHISAALFSSLAKVRMTHVPYKGSAPALVDVIGGHVNVFFISALPSVPHIKAGQIRGLATTGATRLGILPDLPTVAEAGVPGYENSTWAAIGAPARTPQALITRLNREFAAILRMPDIREPLAASGSTVTGGTPEECLAYWKSERAKFAKLIKEAGIKPE